jgi:hypothetical protein
MVVWKEKDMFVVLIKIFRAFENYEDLRITMNLIISAKYFIYKT